MLGARFVKRVVSAPVITALVLAFCATSCGRSPENKAVEFCAVLSDSIGLYLEQPRDSNGLQDWHRENIEPRDT